jgi:hypothetical protein
MRHALTLRILVGDRRAVGVTLVEDAPHLRVGVVMIDEPPLPVFEVRTSSVFNVF